MDLAADCYKLTQAFPVEERYGMTAQIRRAVSSVAANIAEGYGRETTGAFVQFLRVAQGSVRELETHLLLSARVLIVREDQVAQPLGDCERISKMLRSLIRSLEARANV